MFDVLTIAAVADELSESIVGGRIQRIGLIDRLTVGMEVYFARRRRWLVASADNQRGRILLAPEAPSLDPALITPFGLLLRKYLRGGTIAAVEQPPLERLIRISIAKRFGPHNAANREEGGQAQGATGIVEDDNITTDEAVGSDFEDDADEDQEEELDDDGVVYVHLVVELMGRHSNLILVDDDGLIMESAKRVTTAMSRVRPIWPRLVYSPPPPIEKPDPRRFTAVDAVALVDSASPAAKIATTLVRELRAISPQMAREIVFWATGEAEATFGSLGEDGAAALARETRRLLEPLLTSEWSPRVYRDRETEEVVAFAPVPLTYLAGESEEETVDSISEAAALADGEVGVDTPTTHLQRRARLIDAIQSARDRLQGRLASLDAQQAKAAETERLREWGELIYAYLWQIQPGQTQFDADGTSIPLDPALSAKENAQSYFERYRKAQGASEALPALREKAEQEIAYLDQLQTLVTQAQGFAEIEALAAEWDAHAPSSAGTKQKPGGKPRKVQTPRPKAIHDRDGNAIYVGRSGRENDLITFDLAGPEDTWLHARGVPGSHVIVRWRVPSQDDDPETIEAAAALAAYYSAARGSASVEVDVTKRKHVRKIKGAGPGMVTYRQERTIAVRPLDESTLRQTAGVS